MNQANSSATEDAILAIDSTLNKITGFWLEESSAINPKLYSTGYQLLPNCTLQTQRHEVFRNKREAFQRHPKLTTSHPKISEVDPKSSEGLRSWPEDFWKWSEVFRRFTKMTRRLPKISEGGSKNLEGVRGSTEVFRRFPTLDRRVSEVSEVNTNRGDIKLTITVFWLVYRDFVEYAINKKSHDLFVQFVINGYSWCFESSQITLALRLVPINHKLYSRSCDFLYKYKNNT